MSIRVYHARKLEYIIFQGKISLKGKKTDKISPIAELTFVKRKLKTATEKVDVVFNREYEKFSGGFKYEN